MQPLTLIKNCKKSLTGQYLSGTKKILVPSKRRDGNGKFLQIKNAHLNNLKNLDLDISEFVALNFDAVVEIIDAIGGAAYYEVNNY